METINLLSISLTELRELIRTTLSEILEAKLKNLQAEPRPEQEEGLLTRRETSVMLHVSLLTLRNWERRSVLRPRRISRRVLYLKADIMAVLKRMVGKRNAFGNE